MNRNIIMSSEKPQIPNSLNEHWMPFTSNRDFKESPRLIVEAKGVYLKNHQGQTQIDASSGLFCNPLGHGREEIINAITNQLKKYNEYTGFSLSRASWEQIVEFEKNKFLFIIVYCSVFTTMI